MVELVLSFLEGLPPVWTTLIIAALPVIEVRGAIPVALEVFDLPVFWGAFWSFLGSVIPAVILPIVLPPLEAPCRKYSKTCDKLFTWVEKRVEKRYTDKYRALGALGLVVFIAIPLPVTGVWTGSLAAWLFHMRRRYAIPAIIVGTAISSAIVTATTLGFFKAVRFVL